MIIAIESPKGGVGKSTTALTVGGLLAYMGHQVLIMDLESQASATNILLENDEKRKSLYHALMVPDLITPDECIYLANVSDRLDLKNGYREARRNLWIMPGEARLVKAQRDIAAEKRWNALADLLGRMERHFDFVLLDCPPNEDNAMMYAALYAANKIIAPVKTAAMDYNVLKRLLAIIKGIQKSQDERGIAQVQLAGLLPTFYVPGQRVDQQVLYRLKKHFADLVLTPVPRVPGYCQCSSPKISSVRIQWQIARD